MTKGFFLIVASLIAVSGVAIGSGYGLLNHSDAVLNAGEAFRAGGNYIVAIRLLVYLVCVTYCFLLFCSSAKKNAVNLSSAEKRAFLIRLSLYVTIYEIFIAQNILGQLGRTL